ncbi:hypothetical protein ACROYT_G040417 [Oculina patagonica]
MASGFSLPPPTPLEIHDQNTAEKWKKVNLAWNSYLLDMELNKKLEKVQAAALLTVLGEEAGDVYSTFTDWAEEEDQDKIAPVLQKFAEYCQPRKNVLFERYQLNLLRRQRVPCMGLESASCSFRHKKMKRIQWSMPQLYGEDKFLIMLGGLHIEKALWNALGDLLRGSGWTDVLTEAGIATSGTADSFLRASHITRTRHMHQVTALTLAKLQQDAFAKSQEQDSEKWRQEIIKGCPTFHFWDMILRTEIVVLAFIRSHRERDFTLYIECLEELMFLFFALDHVNYSRWASVHLRDMQSLPDKMRDLFSKFWVVQKISTRFSAIPIDQGQRRSRAADRKPDSIEQMANFWPRNGKACHTV